MSPSPPTSPTLSHRRLSNSSSSSSVSKDKPQHLHQTTSDAQEPMQLHIKTPSEETSTLTIPPTTSIATLKSLVALQQRPHLHENAYPSSNQRLLFTGRHLDDPEKTLRDYSVTPGSTINLVLPSRGGGGSGGVEGDLSPSTSNTEVVAETAVASPSVEKPVDDLSATVNVNKPAPAPASDALKASASPLKPKAAAGGMKKKGPRCGAVNCNALAQRIVGECGFCGGLYCGKHRLLESHSCEGLEKAKAEDKERNKDRLEGERTAARGVLGV